MPLDEPSFVDRDSEVVTADIVAGIEGALGRSLLDGQVERLLANQIGYREALTRIALQEAAKQNLVEYARWPALDHLGVLVGTTRLPAQPARTTIRFTAAEPAVEPVGIPAGTQVATPSGKLVFATAELVTLAIGETMIEVEALATADGPDHNGLAIGTITKLPAPIAGIEGAANITASAGGALIEDDENFRTRIKLAPNAFSTAGPRKAYVALARDAHQDIVDVAVLSPEPGDIDVYPLTRTGLPSAEIKALVDVAIEGETKRPQGDNVTVLDPVAVPYAIEAAVEITLGTDEVAALARCEQALQAVADRWAERLGNDITRITLQAALEAVAGVYDAEVTSPATTALSEEEWPQLTGITVTITETVDVG